MQLGSSNHIDVILMRKCSKVQVFYNIKFRYIKFYWLEVGEWKEVEREREEEAKVLLMNMIMQVICFCCCCCRCFGYYVRGKIKKNYLENVITSELREQFSTRVGQLLSIFDLCRINNLINSMPKRIRLLKKAKGQRIKY